MQILDLDDVRSHSDMLRVRGEAVTVRFAEVADAEALQGYFRSLSQRSRYNRLMGAASELPAGQLEKFVHLGEGGSFSVLATVLRDGHELIVGEARYAFDEDSARFEFGLSIADAFQRRGLGAVLLSNLECRAAALGAARMFGDTLQTNDAMRALALREGFVLTRTPGDWKQVRFEKRIDGAPQGIPCASWRMAAPAAEAAVAH